MSQLFNKEAEQSVIASVVQGGADAQALCKIVGAADFYEVRNQPIWAGIASLASRGEQVDLVVLSDEMERMGVLAEVGGIGGLSEVVLDAPASSVADKYAAIVADFALRRRVIEAMRQAAADVSTNGTDIKSTLSGMASLVGTYMPAATDAELKLAREYLNDEFITPLDNRMQGIVEAMGLPTGLRDLDEATNGLHGNNLIILAGRPGMGKSAFSIGMMGANLNPETPQLFKSLEMKRDKVLARLVCNVGNIPLQFVAKPDQYEMHQQQQYFAQMAHPVNLIQSAPLYISDRSGVSIAAIREDCEVIKERHGKVGIVYIDYLSKVRIDGSHARHDQALGEVVIGAKAIARDFDCVVVLLAQLNRGVEQRPNKRPMLSDLKDSSDIEQEADEIWFLYRDEYYNKDNPDNRGLAECIRGKAREGETCTIHMRSKLANARFEDMPVDGVQY